MDVRCEKCQTEYELDESRLKPGGVTVKCTNCGHMFKIRKRTPTNVGIPAIDRARPASSRPPMASPEPRREDTVPSRVPPTRADSVLGDGSPTSVTDQGSGPTGERQWMVRLENGETKTCRELATLQQWIVAGVATREALISRSGKTWKRLGDIGELGQYFVIADEARNQRSAKPTPPPRTPVQAPTMLGVGKASAAGGTILPDDEADDRSTGNYRSRPRTTPPPPPARVSTAPQNKPNPLAQTELAPSGPQPRASTPPPIPAGARMTAGWANADIKASDSMAAMPQGPRGGKLSSIPANEPAFSGRVRMDPGDESSFDTGKVRIDDDDDMMPVHRGSRAGTWLVVLALLVIAGAAGAVYMFVFHKKVPKEAAQPPRDAAVVAVATPDATAIVPPIDAGAPVPVDPFDGAKTELAGGVEPRIKGVYDSLAGKDDPASLAVRARLATGLAESMTERAGLATDKPEADKLRKEAKQLVIDAATLAQRAIKAQADDPNASLAMADVLRLQGKPAKDVRRYLDGARAKAGDDKELARAIALGDAELSMRDGKLDDALQALAKVDAAGDNRVQIAFALIAYAQNKAADAKPIVDQILTTSADHDVARALAKRLETMVAKTDPLPPEDGGKDGGKGSATHVVTQDPNPPTNGGGGGGGGGDYDSLLAHANKLAEGNCSKAMELYAKALEQKPTGVEALTGMGYCYLDAKQFSSAFSKFRTALAVSSRYEPALAGIAETYQQQSNKEQAIEAWRRYLEAYPGAPKAKKQLELLGASAEGGTPPPAGSAASGSAAAPTPPAPTPPPPAPTPAPAPAPAGSAS